jgi:hypothetical protein
LVTVENLLQPTVTSSGSGTTFCQGGSTTLDAGSGYASYLWSDGSTTTQTLVVTQSGQYAVRCTTQAGCVGQSVPVNVTVHITTNPTVISSGPTSFCPGSQVTLCGSPGFVQYQWANGPATQCLTTSNAIQTQLTVVDVNGCSTTSQQIQTQVYTLITPEITVSGPTEFCVGGGVILDVGPGFASYLWSSGSTTPSVYATQSGSYSVIVLDQHGCIDSSLQSTPIQVTVWKPYPQISQNGIVLSSTPFVSYQWHELRFDVYDSLLVGQTNQTYSVWRNSWYFVVVTDANGCVGSSDTVYIERKSPDGIEETFADNLAIFPNPADDHLQIEFNLSSPAEVSIYLTDLAGRVVKLVTESQKALEIKSSVSLNDLSNGTYMVWIESGGQKITKRITKH